MDWLTKELAFITFLYKYKSFLGTLKRKDFNDYSTREEAWEQFESGKPKIKAIEVSKGKIVGGNKTNNRIISLWNKGNHSLSSIARHIGRPGIEGMERVKQALLKAHLIENEKNSY